MALLPGQKLHGKTGRRCLAASGCSLDLRTRSVSSNMFQQFPTYGRVMKGQDSGHQPHLMVYLFKFLFLLVLTALPILNSENPRERLKMPPCLERLPTSGRSQSTCAWSNFVLVRPRLFSCRFLVFVFFLGGRPFSPKLCDIFVIIALGNAVEPPPGLRDEPRNARTLCLLLPEVV